MRWVSKSASFSANHTCRFVSKMRDKRAVFSHSIPNYRQVNEFRHKLKSSIFDNLNNFQGWKKMTIFLNQQNRIFYLNQIFHLNWVFYIFLKLQIVFGTITSFST